MNEVELFLESCRSEETRKQYNTYLKKWLTFVGLELSFDNINRKAIEDKIIEYIIYLKKQGKSKVAIHNYLEPVCSLYAINDVILNRKKINKFVPENRKIKNDRAYTHEEISKLLEIADERMRVIILLMSSTGIRIGAVPSIKLKDLQDAKLTIYENTNEEHFTFISPECEKAVKFYLDMRSRYGEKLTDKSLLIREQFDVRLPAPVKARQISKTAIQLKLYDLCRRCGIDKQDIAIAHGFRKFFMNQCVNSKMNPEIREMILGHKIGLASAYYRPTEQEMFSEYQKAVNNLTINEENRLKFKVNQLTERQDEIELMKLKHEKEMEAMDHKLNKIMSIVQQNPKLAHAKPEALLKDNRT
jgi:integrase